MKVLRGVLILLLLLAIAYLVWMYFLPSRLFIEKSVTVQASQEEVYQELADFRNWEPWSPWKMRDTTVRFTYLENTTAPDGAYQFSYGDMTGKQTFTGANAPDSLLTSIQFRGLQPGVGSWHLAATDSGTAVHWQMMAEYGYLERVIGVFMQRQMNQFYEEALAALKRHLEGSELAYPVAETQMPAISFYALEDTVAPAGITNDYMAAQYLKIYKYLGKDYDTSYYAPMALYSQWGSSSEPAVLRVALPSEAQRSGTAQISAGQTEARPALEVRYRGPYHKREKAYRALQQYAAQKSLTLTGPLVELYLSGPGERAAAPKPVTRLLQAYEPDTLR